jgi:imidazole glycerol-phosphate synthase subunit HisH
MNIAIIKYNAGNVQSVIYALERLGVKPLLTDKPEELRRADKVIFPGVGEARSTMKYLRERGLDVVIRSLTQPVLATCIGMQLLCEYSEEHDTECLGIIPAHVVRFPHNSNEKIPHVGWNTLTAMRSPLFNNLPRPQSISTDAGQPHIYYVHSYCVLPNAYTIAETEYIIPFSAGLQKDNFYALQFHAEISGAIGSKILHNFLHL